MPLLPCQHPSNCKNCSLGEQEGVQVVHSILPSEARVLFIGESPGDDENEQGVPFVGRTGELLDEIFKEVGIPRNSIAVTNTVACRPPEKRPPVPKEVKACSEFLLKEIEMLKPSLIVTLGATASKTIFPNLGNITKVRGVFYDHPELLCKLLPTFHPAYVLKNPTERHLLVEDLSKAAAYMNGSFIIPEPLLTHYHVIQRRDQLDWIVNQLHENKLWACDTETTSINTLEAEIFIITVSWKPQTAVLLDCRYFRDTPENLSYFWSKVKEVMENDSKKVFHNGGYDLQCFMNHGISVQNYYADTLLMHYLLNEETHHGLEVLAWEYTDFGGYELTLSRYIEEHPIETYRDIPMEIIHPYALKDADATFRSYLAMYPKIQQQQLSYVLHDIMMPTQKILLRTEHDGVSVDKPYLDKTIAKYTLKMEEQLVTVRSVPQVRQFVEEKRAAETAALKQKWEKSKTLTKRHSQFEDYLQTRLLKSPDLLTTEFNVNSPKQLKELLIDKMRLKVIKVTDSGQPSTDAEVLAEYAKANSFCNALLEYRTLSHLKSTFLEGIANRLTPQNRVHTDYFLWSTNTGRISSRDPNLGNIPTSKTAGDIKDIFCADLGTGDWLVEADMAQAEFRIWMQYSQDPQALEDLNNGLDIHKLIAAVAYHNVKLPRGTITYEQFLELTKDVTKDERTPTKTIVFGCMYGRGAPSIAKQLDISTVEAQKIIDIFFARYPQASFWLKTTISKTRRDGYVVNLFGRRRRLSNINVSDGKLRGEAERQAVNSPIQSAASDLTFLAAIRIFRYIWENRMKTRLVLTVYDSIVLNVPDEELKTVIELVSTEMIKKPLPSITVPLGAELKVGSHWGSTIEINPKEDWNILYNKLLTHRKQTDKKFI